jgi:glucose-1-phosphate thymidylyltransferase
MNIIIPMAGWGTRLRPHTLTVPKPMLSVAGKPIVEHLVNDLVKCVDEKIENVVFIIRSDFGKK